MDLGMDLDGLQNIILKYVDDSKIINSWRNEDDIISNQDVMDKLYPWAEMNNMSWHDLKYQVVRIGNSDLIEETEILTPDYNELITRKPFVKDLGILVDRKVTFSEQVYKAVSKTNQKAGWIMQTFTNREIEFMRILWRSLCQPHLDYCNVLWAPIGLKGDTIMMEKPLQNFTKKAKGCFNMNYWERLDKSKLSSNFR